MTGDELKACFDKNKDEFLKFKRIPKADRRHHRPDLCALIYLDEKLGGGDADAVSHAEHDEVWLVWDNLKKLTEEDVVYVHRCGVRYDDDQDCLAMFV